MVAEIGSNAAYVSTALQGQARSAFTLGAIGRAAETQTQTTARLFGAPGPTAAAPVPAGGGGTVTETRGQLLNIVV